MVDLVEAKWMSHKLHKDFRETLQITGKICVFFLWCVLLVEVGEGKRGETNTVSW